MIKVRDFKCNSCNKIFEVFVKDDEQTITCTCGSVAYAIVSSPRFRLDPVSGDFPTATAKWIREHEQAGSSTTR